MRVLFFEYKRFFRWILICCAIVAVAVTGYGLLEYKATLPTTKQYDPIYQGNSNQKKVALICNVVWGEEFIPEMLQILRTQDTKITFFVGGKWAEDFPELTEMIDKEDHEIGNHGYNHLKPTEVSESTNASEIKKTEAILSKLTKNPAKLFHPPYREVNDAVAKVAGELGYKTIMSSVDTIDWQRPAPEVIVERVVTKVHNGAIILMHPTAPTVKALPTMIKELKSKGYEIVTVGQLLATSPSDSEKSKGQKQKQ